MMTSENSTKHPKNGRIARGLAVAIAALVMSVGVSSVAPQKAEAVAVDSQGSYAEAGYSCFLGGTVFYTGAGFEQIRVITYINGRGYLTGPWTRFQRAATESRPAWTFPPVAPKGSTYAVIAQYRTWNPVTRTWSSASEWLRNERNSYWCRA